MTIIKTRYKIVAISIVVIFALIAAVWYKINVYPFKYAENFYKENKEQIDSIVAYFEGFDNIYSAQMNTDGVTKVVSSEGSQNVNCLSDEGYNALLILREKYIDDSNEKYERQSYVLNYISAEYDGNGNMILEIPVYARVLNTDTSVDTPNRIVYYLAYIDDDYSGDDAPKIKGENAINDNWFIISETHTAG